MARGSLWGEGAGEAFGQSQGRDPAVCARPRRVDLQRGDEVLQARGAQERRGAREEPGLASEGGSEQRDECRRRDLLGVCEDEGPGVFGAARQAMADEACQVPYAEEGAAVGHLRKR